MIATESAAADPRWSTTCSTSRGSRPAQLEPRRDWCSVEELIEAAIASSVAAGRASSVSVEPRPAAGRGRLAQIERALANLLENAIRYAGGDPVTVARASARAAVAIRVADRGPGHPARELERIFEPFHTRGRATGTGSGLGLAIARGLRRGQRRPPPRRVAARARARRFAIELPLAAGGQGARSRAGRRAVSARTRVLVCDDESQILRALRVILARRRLRGGRRRRPPREALDPAAVRPPDAAIIDLVLPDGDGVEVTPLDPRVERRCRSSSSRRSATRREGARARRRRRRLRDQAVRPATSSSPGCTPRCAARGPPSRRARDRRRRARDRPRRAHASRRDGEEIHLTPTEFDLLRVLIAQPRPPDHAPRAAARGLGARLRRTTPRCCASTSPTCAARSSREPGSPRLIRTDPGVGYRFALGLAPASRASLYSGARDLRAALDAIGRRLIERACHAYTRAVRRRYPPPGLRPRPRHRRRSRGRRELPCEPPARDRAERESVSSARPRRHDLAAEACVRSRDAR